MSTHSSVHYKSGMNVKLGMYHKQIVECSKVELLAILQHVTGVRNIKSSSKTKAELFTLVLIAAPSLCASGETHVFFSVEEHDVSGTLRRRIRARVTVPDTSQYSEHRPASAGSPQISNEQFQEYVGLATQDGVDFEEDEEEEEDNKDNIKQQDTNSQTVDTPPSHVSGHTSNSGDTVQGVHLHYMELMDRMMNSLADKQSTGDTRISKLTALNPKHLRFDPEDGVGNFLTNIETAARGHRITKDTDIIQMAVSSLSTSTKGFELLGLCGPEEYADWTKFKAKLYLMESSNEESFSKKFKNYKRAEGQHAASLMSKLKDLYCKSRGYKNAAELDDRDLRTIREKFFDTLDPSLAGLGKQLFSERNRDPNEHVLDSIARLIVEVELNFNLGVHKTASTSLNNIFQANQPVNQITSTHTDEVADLKAMICQLSEEVEKINAIRMGPPNQTSQSQPRGQNQQYRSQREQASTFSQNMRGFCYRKIASKCPNQFCKYDHGRAPQDVVDYVRRRAESQQ